MSGPNRLLVAVGLLFIAAPVVCAADETYDLRGPAPKKGLVTLDTDKFTMKNADITIDLGGVKREGKRDTTSVTEKEVEFLAVDGRNVTRLRTKLFKDETKRKLRFGNETDNETYKNALQGQIIYSELTKKGWKHSLEDAAPDEKQKNELKDFDNPENDDDLYPAEKVKVGHVWDIDAKAVAKIFGSKMTDAKGTGKAKFLRVELYDKVLCAVIETDIDIKAKLKQDENESETEMKGKVLTYRSIADGIDLKYTIEGTSKFSETAVDEDGVKHMMQYSGKMYCEGTSKILKQ